MAEVLVEGIFMGANIKSSTFEGNTKNSLLIDIYQPTSKSSEKMVQLKTSDVGLYQNVINDYAMGSIVKANASINAYQNKAYFNLVNFVDVV